MVTNNTELYVGYIIILSIIIKFLTVKTTITKVRTMLKVEELEAYITSNCKRWKPWKIRRIDEVWFF